MRLLGAVGRADVAWDMRTVDAFERNAGKRMAFLQRGIRSILCFDWEMDTDGVPNGNRCGGFVRMWRHVP